MTRRSELLFGSGAGAAFVLALLVYSQLAPDAFPAAASGINSSTAVSVAESFAADIGIGSITPQRPVTGYDSLAAAWFSDVHRPDLAIYAAELPIYYWQITDDSTKCQFKVTPAGSVTGFQCPIDSARSISGTALLEWLEEIAGKDDSPDLAQLDSILSNGTGQFKWTRAASSTAGVDLTCDVTAAEGSFSIARTVAVPENEASNIRRAEFIGEATSTTGFVGTLILIILAIGVLLQNKRRRNSSALTALTVVLAVLALIASVNNSFTGSTVSPPSGISESSYRAAMMISSSFAAVLLFITVKMCGEAGAILPRVLHAAQRPRPQPFTRTIGIGYLAAAIWLVLSSLFYSSGERYGIVSLRLGPPDEFSLATLIPLVTPVASAAIASCQEEILFRWFALRYFAWRFHSQAIGILTTALIWALLHANYAVRPPCTRIVELFPLGLLLGWIAVRFGILTAIMTHYVVDFATIALPMARAGSVLMAALLAILLALPPIILIIPRIRNFLPAEVDDRGNPSRQTASSTHTLTGLTAHRAPQLPPTVSPASASIAIETIGLCKNYDEFRALKNISCALPYGEVSCLLGPNGAGKTTLMRILVGHATITAGEARLHLDLRDGASPGAQVGYVPDDSMVYPLLTVAEHLRFVEAVYELTRLSQTDEHQFLKRFGLDEHTNVLASRLSKGLKKRLILACAVRHGAQIFILDEPFDGLDPAGQKMLMSLIFQLRDAGKCILISTHRLDIAEKINDRLLVLSHGELTFAGTNREFIGLAIGTAPSDQTQFERAFVITSTEDPMIRRGS